MIATSHTECALCGRPIKPGQNIVPTHGSWAHISCKYGE